MRIGLPRGFFSQGYQALCSTAGRVHGLDFSMRNKIIAVLVLPIVLGLVSPFLASPDDGPILWTWFNWMPMRMDLSG